MKGIGKYKRNSRKKGLTKHGQKTVVDVEIGHWGYP